MIYLARIRTHARLRRSVYGLEPVVNTTAPPPRLRVKGVQNEVMYKRTIQIRNFLRRGWWEFLVRVRVALASSTYNKKVHMSPIISLKTYTL